MPGSRGRPGSTSRVPGRRTLAWPSAQLIDDLEWGRDSLFALPRSGLDFSAVFAGPIEAEEGAFLRYCLVKSRHRQFFAIHAIDPALHQRIALARHAVEPCPVDLDQAAPVGPNSPCRAKLAHRQR